MAGKHKGRKNCKLVGLGTVVRIHNKKNKEEKTSSKGKKARLANREGEPKKKREKGGRVKFAPREWEGEDWKGRVTYGSGGGDHQRE